jgi:tRNA nucleotidyltransferase (CCA-adding enzyme)
MEALKINAEIPANVQDCVQTLQKAGFEAYLVGGCVRDLLIGRTPKDWDITTNAIPEEIIGLFPKTFYENTYGTVGVVYEEIEAPDLRLIEVTPYRIESDYKDARHPESVIFSKNIHDDLRRRDFTINAIAYDPTNNVLVDDFNGKGDIESKTLRTVSSPDERFLEDGLRIIRAVRLASELGFTIASETEEAIIRHHSVLEKIAKERVRDEFSKLIMSDNGAMGIFVLQRLGLLLYIIPELEEGLHMKQNQAHSFEVFEHLVRSLQCAIDKKYPLEVRLAALLHDIGKPRSRRMSEEKGDYTFYGHEVIGSKMAKIILDRLKFSRETTIVVTKLVRWHMFFSDVDQITLSAVRRMVMNVGDKLIWDLINLRICDRIGTGRPKEDPYRLRKYISMIEEVLRDPVSVGLLKISGQDIIETLGISPGPKIGFMLNILLEEVIEDPTLNNREYLVSQVTKLATIDENKLKAMSTEAISKKNLVEEAELKVIKDKYRVK